jgi:hypothetical protein
MPPHAQQYSALTTLRLCRIAHLRAYRLAGNEKRAPTQASSSTIKRIANLLKPFSIGTSGLTSQDDILTVSVEKHDHVTTAVLENWKPISSRGSGAKNEVGYTPGYARNIEFRTVRLPRRGAIVRDGLVIRGKTGFFDSLDDFLQSQG